MCVCVCYGWRVSCSLCANGHIVFSYMYCVCVCVCHGNDDKKSGEEMKGENEKALGKEREMVTVS